MDKNFQKLLKETIVSGNQRHDIESDKIGFDWANKKMIARVYTSLHDMFAMDFYGLKRSWTNIVRHMFAIEGKDITTINVNGYYSTIRKILKDIEVIAYDDKKQLVEGKNFYRFFGDEDWSWFETSTECGGYGQIVKQ